MKTLLVRLSVLTLAATGFAASTVISQNSGKTSVSTPVIGNAGPAPCLPTGADKCGMCMQGNQCSY